MAINIESLKNRAIRIKEETRVASITPDDVGALMEDIIELCESIESKTTDFVTLQRFNEEVQSRESGDDALADEISAGDKAITDLIGAANGIASLDGNGKVPASQLPDYVDDIKECHNLSAFPTTGIASILYVDLSTDKVYRWSGSQYTEVSKSLALGETASTAYSGLKGKQLAEKLQELINSKGQANGIAPLNFEAKVPATHLPMNYNQFDITIQEDANFVTQHIWGSIEIDMLKTDGVQSLYITYNSVRMQINLPFAGTLVLPANTWIRWDVEKNSGQAAASISYHYNNIQ